MKSAVRNRFILTIIMTKFSAILATGRISNLPTVWCNVLVAFLLVQLAPILWADYPESTFSLTLLIATCIAASCLYVGGCFLGDAVDVEFDQKHKPSRPIPSGVINRSTIYTWASFLITAGIVIPTAFIYFSTEALNLVALPASLLLTAAIVIYSLWHKRSPWIGLPFIGACRFFLVLFGAYVSISVVPTLQEVYDSTIKNETSALTVVCGNEGVRPIVYLYALVVGIFTISFASVASSESSPKPITWRKVLMTIMLALPLLPLAINFLVLEQVSLTLCSALGYYYVWMVSAFMLINTNKGQFVSRSLAGFCLLDACFAAAFGWQWLLVCLGLFALSLFLQKFAPAT